MKRTLLLLGFLGLLVGVHLTDPDEETDQIVGGVAANIKDYPYMASLNLAGSLCGGTLYKGSYIITAAHCVYGKAQSSVSSFTVLLNSTTLNAAAGSISRKVRKFVYHSSYNPKTMDNDVALLALATPVTTLPSVSLPAAGSTTTYAGKTATIIGWGTTKSGGSISNTLLKANVQVLDNAVCSTSYSGINNLKVCAAAAGKDTCQGDSGGPLLVDGVQVGITSYGNGCANPKYPGVYARVTSLSSWITKTAPTL